MAQPHYEDIRPPYPRADSDSSFRGSFERLNNYTNDSQVAIIPDQLREIMRDLIRQSVRDEVQSRFESVVGPPPTNDEKSNHTPHSPRRNASRRPRELAAPRYSVHDEFDQRDFQSTSMRREQSRHDGQANIERTHSHASSHHYAATSLSKGREMAFVFIVCMAQLMTQAAFTQNLNSLHIIGSDLGTTNPGMLSWFIAAYSLTVGTFILVAGRFGDLFGYKKMYIIGFIWFAVWSAVVGASAYSNEYLFITGRALQGIGPAILLPNGLAILGSSYAPGPKKHMVFALFGAVAPTGALLGAVFGGLFAQLVWWPWLFWACAIACIVFAILGQIIIPDPPPNPSNFKSWSEKVRDMDLLGALTGVTSLVLINIAWNQAPIDGWETSYVYFMLIIGFILLAVFFLVELRLAPMPLLPLASFNSDVGFVLACIACGWATFGIWVYYLFQFIQEIRGYGPLAMAAQLVPASPFGFIAAILTGIMMSKVRPAWIMVGALCAFMTATILVATAPVHQTYWAQTFVSLFIAPFGMDMSFPAGTVILSDAVGKRHQGIAASLVATVVNYSISLGLGFAGTVEVNVNDGGGTKELLLKGYRGAWYMGIGLSGLGVVISIIFLIKTYLPGARSKSGKMKDVEKEMVNSPALPADDGTMSTPIAYPPNVASNPIREPIPDSERMSALPR